LRLSLLTFGPEASADASSAWLMARDYYAEAETLSIIIDVIRLVVPMGNALA
jgi:hypothetical protein